MNVLELIQHTYIHNRRVKVLCRHLQELLPQGARVLDVACRDGLLSKVIDLSVPPGQSKTAASRLS